MLGMKKTTNLRENEWIDRRLAELGLEKKDLAEALKVPQSRVSEIINGKRKVKGTETLPLSETLGMNIVEVLRLLGGSSELSTASILLDAQENAANDREPDESDFGHPQSYVGPLRSRTIEFADTEFAAIGRYDAAFSAGPGCLMEDDPEPLGYHLIEASWLRSVTSAAPEHLSIVRVDGDSMESTLNHGDWILVDMTKHQFTKEGIYALNVFGQTWVKRLSVNISKKLIRIMSDNSKYEMQELPEHEITIIGRIVSIVARRLY